MNRSESIIRASLLGALLVGGLPLGQSAWGAPPAKPDSIKPAPISTISVKPSARALTLRFVASGDDGSAGQAARYDVFYRYRQSAENCSDNPGLDPDSNGSWSRAERSAETIPEPGGKVDFFNVRTLDEGQGYCVALRVRDEVPNWSAWTTVSSNTTAVAESAWMLTAGDATAPSDNSLVANRLHLALVGGEQLLGWSLHSSTHTSRGWVQTEDRVVFYGGSGWRQQVSLASYVNTGELLSSFRMAGVPGYAGAGAAAGGAVVVRYDAGAGLSGRRVLLLEAGPEYATITEVASGTSSAGGIDAFGFGTSSLVYAKSNGAWNPATTLQRVEASTKSYKRTALEIQERVDGSWTATPVLRRASSSPGTNFFPEAEVFATPAGNLGVVAAHCGVTVYAVRESSGWAYYDAGPALTRYRVSFDSNGDAVVLGQTSYGKPNPVILREGSSGFPEFALGAGTCTTPGATQTTSSEIVSGLPVDTDLPWMHTSGIADVAGATFISAASNDGNYLASQQQLIYRCRGTEPWTLVKIDSTNAAPRAQPVVDANGNLLAAYNWGRFSRAAPVGPQYTRPPVDQVYVASHAGNYCGVTR